MVEIPNTVRRKPSLLPRLIVRSTALAPPLVCLSLNILWFFLSLPVCAGNIASQQPAIAAASPANRLSAAASPAGPTDLQGVLRDLLAVTVERSPDFQTARALKEQKKYQRYTAKAGRFAPSAVVEISRERAINGDWDKAQASTADAAEGTQDYKDGEYLTDWNLDLDLPLYRRSVVVEDAIAGLEYDLAAVDYDIAVRELEIKLRELLGGYMLACYNLLSLENSIRFSADHVAQIQRGYDLRDQTKLALLRAQANFEELGSKKELYEQRKDQAHRALLDYTALETGDPLLVRLEALLSDEQRVAGLIGRFSTVENVSQEIMPLLDDAPEDELRSFFEKKSLLSRRIRLEQERAGAQAGRYTQDEFPELAVRGELQRTEDTPFKDLDGEGSIGLVLKVPVFSGGTVYSNSMTEKSARRAALVQGQADLRKQFNALANKRKTIQSLRKVYERQKTFLQQQQEIVRLSLKSYQIKQTSMQELLNSKNDLIDAKSSFMQTNIDMNILLARFAWELGVPLSY